MVKRVISAIGDSIVDTVGRGSPPVTDKTQWLYQLMRTLEGSGSTISLEPIPEFVKTPNLFSLVGVTWPEYPNLVDGNLDTYSTFTDTSLYITLPNLYQIFAVRVFTKDTPFSLKVFRSPSPGGPWTDPTIIQGDPDNPSPLIRLTDHEPSYQHVNWWAWRYWNAGTGVYIDSPWNYFSGAVSNPTRYLKLEITGTMTVSDIQVLANTGNDRGSFLNKIVGENYIINNLGLGSEETGGCLGRFQDVVELNSDVIIILAGINDISQDRETSKTQQNLLDMYNWADQEQITCIPVKLLPYNAQPSRFNEINGEILSLNTWIEQESVLRRYSFLDWYAAMEDPLRPGHLDLRYTTDGIHLSVEGNNKIIESFDLNVFTEVTHDLYAMPLFAIPFTASRVGISPTVNITFGNSKELNYRIYRSSMPNITVNNTLIHEVINSSGLKNFNYTVLEEGYYKCFGSDTGVQSVEIYVESVPPPPEEPQEKPEITITYIPKLGYSAMVEIEEQDE